MFTCLLSCVNTARFADQNLVGEGVYNKLRFPDTSWLVDHLPGKGHLGALGKFEN